jgi:dihydropyrimidinase
MAFDLVITNGTIVTAWHTVRADIGIVGEQIAAIGTHLTGARVLDAAGKLVIPGGVDIHVHMELALAPDIVSSDTFYTGTRAAALGGTTTIIDFVEAKPDESLLAALARRRAVADPQVVIDYGLHMTIGPWDIAKLAEVPAVVAAGGTSFKLYMAYGLRLDDGQLLQALEAVRDAGGRPVIHCENWDIIGTLVRRHLAAGRTEPRWHPRSRPELLEGEAADRAITIAEYVGVPLHIFHVSCGAVVERMRAARARGLPVTGETCPQYLFLSDAAYEAPGLEGLLPICAPPLRPAVEQQVLWQALAAGDLQLVATDHCPFDRATKARGLGDFSRTPGGVPSIEMRLAGVYQGVVRGRFSANRWVELCCTAPARLMGLERKGDIAVGMDADLVVFDPERRVTLSTAFLHENVDWTPYEGLELVGWPETVLSRGRVIVANGAFQGEPGRGRFVHRRPGQA